MPVIPPFPSSVAPEIFWSTEEVLNLARMLSNDMQGGVQGQILADDNPYTWYLLNFCYANLMNWLTDSGVESVAVAEAIVGPLAIAPTASIDPNTQVRLGYDGYWDGSNEDETDTTIALPWDMLMPMRLWERPSGSSQPFFPMKQVLGGLPAVYGAYRFGVWEFRGNAIYFPGCVTTQEVRIRYTPGLGLLIQPGPDDPAPQIPLAFAGQALAYLIAAEFAEIRSAPNAMLLRSKANEQLNMLANKSARRSNNVDQRRKGYGYGRRRRGGYGVPGI